MMLDLLPLVLVCLGVGLASSAIFLARKNVLIVRGVPGLVGVIFIGIVVVSAPYVAYVFPGDPDVWDFYRSVWWLPAVVLGPLAALATYLIGFRNPSSGRPGSA